MSDIGIRNMDMPKTCKECIEMEIPVRCRVIKQEPVTAIMTGYNRPKDCPLVELPPHGRWQTGEPTEEGYYLIAFHPWGRKENGICYSCLEWKDNHWFDPVYCCDTDPYLIAWQKIEPYKED